VRERKSETRWWKGEEKTREQKRRQENRRERENTLLMK
jgi:hypothetical protein